MVVLAKVGLPEFGIENSLPAIPLSEYRQRLDRLHRAMRAERFDFLLVYADREHAANLNYLTGFEPRFEEAVLLIDCRGQRLLLVGNECLGYLPDSGLGCEVELFQELSLPGQDKSRSRSLDSIFTHFGMGPTHRAGCIGWKYWSRQEQGEYSTWIEIPSFLVDQLRACVGDPQLVVNATALLMDVDHGHRLFNCVDQIARFEYAAIRTSTSIREALRRLAEGVREYDLEQYFQGGGLPYSCHPMISFGDKARRGLSSPSNNRARLGDPFTLAFGIEGALNCRAGIIAQDASELGDGLKTFYPRYAANYFDVVATWYESLKIGVTGGEVFSRVEATRDASLYHFAVNPGHYLHLDEWVNSPFASGNQTPLQSGMALQMDIIPVSDGPFCYINAEDGIVLADENLRQSLAQDYPQCWRRITARQGFMRDIIGIDIDDSVLPLGNMPGVLNPYALSPDLAFIRG